MKKLFLLMAATLGLMTAAATTYTKVTTAPANWAGDYLIVYEDKNVALNGALGTGLDVVNNNVPVTIADGVITGSTTIDAAAVTLAAFESGYSIQLPTGDYIYNTSAKNQIKFGNAVAHTITLSNGGDVVIQETGYNTYLRINSASDQMRFRYFTSTGNVQLYKKDGASSDNPAASLSLNKTSGTCNQYERFTLQATAVGTDPTKPCTDAINWESSNTSLATVTAGGTVTTSGYGSVTITATCGTKTATCALTIQEVPGFVLTFPALDGQTPVTTYTQPWQATMCGVTWDLSKWNNNNNKWPYAQARGDTEPATIDCHLAMAPIGSVHITVDQVSRPENCTLTLLVADNADFTEADEYPIVLEGAGVVSTAIDIKGQSYYRLLAKVGTNPTGQTLRISRIEYCIGATTPTTPTWVNGVMLNNNSVTLTEGGKTTLTATVSPFTATDKSVTWTSSDVAVATVNNGVVNAIGAGTASITATTNDGHYTATCAVTVDAAPIEAESVSISPKTATIQIGSAQQLTATVLPAEAAGKTITWTSLHTTIASVNSTGVVTGVGVGEAKIVATVAGTDIRDTATITVEQGDTPAGEEYTGTFTNKDWANVAGVWEKVSSGSQFQNQGVQITTGFSGAGVVSADEFESVTAIRVKYCTNGSSGVGNMVVTVGDNTSHTIALSKDGGTTLRDLTLLINPAEEGTVTVSFTCTNNSLYINSLTIVGVKKGVVPPTPPTVAKKYARVTTAPTNWCGTYLLYCPAAKGVMNGALSSSEIDATTGNILAVESPNIVGDTIYGIEEVNDATFYIESYDGAYSIYSVKNEYYLGLGASSQSGLSRSTTASADTKLNITLTSDGSAKLEVANSTVSPKPYLQYNADASRIRFYKSAQSAIQLFHLVGEDDPTVGVQTQVTTATGVMYNVMGQRVDHEYKGIVIVDGKKYLKR